MQLNANAVSTIDKVRHEFEDNMKARLVNDTFRTIVTQSIPLHDGEDTKINNPDFRNKLSEVLSDVSKEMVNKFDNVGNFDTGNLMTSMVTSISDSVSLEADYRQQKLMNKIVLGKLDQNSVEALNTAIYEAFADVKSFESADVKNRFKQELSYILSTEDAADVIERIKNDVKDAIDETEAKNDLVEGTTQEIIDYKNEIAPPDDEYQDPNAGEQPDAGEVDPAAETDDGIADVGDDGLSEGDEGEDDQIYEGEGDDLGTDSSMTGEENDGDNTDPEMEGEEPDVSEDGVPTEEGGNDLGGDEGLGDGSGDLGEGTGDGLDGGDDLGGEEGEVEGDPELAGDPNMDNGDIGEPTEPAPAPETPAVSDGNSNQNSGGITININGADLKAAKESLNIFNARTLAAKRIPLHPTEFSNSKLPSVETLSAECTNAVGDVSKEMKYRLDGLRYALKHGNYSQEQYDIIEAKINDYGKIIGESVSKAKDYRKTFESMGLTPEGLIYATENTLCIARNIINRFITKKQFVSPTVRPYTSKENTFANAFDIVQLRQYLTKKDNPNQAMVDDLIARENLFYHNMVNFNDADVKQQATAIIDLSALNFRKAMSPNFITDYKIKAWEINVGDKANKDINEEVVKRVKDKFEKLWLRELNADEMKIIRGAANQEDVTELTPTPYEKFMITMTKESILAHGSEDPTVGAKLSKEEKRDIEWKSRLMTTVYKAGEAFGIFDHSDQRDFEKFTTMIGM